jgi:hypothetical protein
VIATTTTLPTDFPSAVPVLSRAPTVAGKPTTIPSPNRENTSFSPNTVPFSVIPSTSRFQGSLFLFGSMSQPPDEEFTSNIQNIQLERNSILNQRSFVVFGRKNGFVHNLELNESLNSGSVTEIHRSIVVLSHDSMTRSSAVVDDLNHDGFPDLIVGYPLSSTCMLYFNNQTRPTRRIYQLNGVAHDLWSDPE